MCRRERELVEVVVDRLDLAVVDDLVPEPEERVLDQTADVGRGMERPEPAFLARKSDVDALLPEAAIELGALERVPSRLDLGLEALADRVQEPSGFAVADVAQRLRELALTPQVADARVVQLGQGGRARNRACSLGFEGLRVHRANVSSAPSSYRSCGATILLPTAIVMRKPSPVCARREPR